MNTLTRKLNELFKKSSQLRKDYQRFRLKWTEDKGKGGMLRKKMELFQAHQRTDQPRREKSSLCDELDMRNKTSQGDRARNC